MPGGRGRGHGDQKFTKKRLEKQLVISIRIKLKQSSYMDMGNVILFIGTKSMQNNISI